MAFTRSGYLEHLAYVSGNVVPLILSIPEKTLLVKGEFLIVNFLAFLLIFPCVFLYKVDNKLNRSVLLNLPLGILIISGYTHT